MTEPCAEWEGSDLLDLFLRNDVSEHKPRPTTGQIQVQKEGDVMTVQSDEHLPSILQKLSTEGFLGAPVCSGSELLGHISMLDLTKFVNGLFFATSEEDWQEFWQKKLCFQQATALSIMDLPNKKMSKPFPVMNHRFSSFSALEMMARNKSHQVLLMDDDDQLCGILTQSMLISFLRQNKNKWGKEFRNLKVRDFKDFGLKKLQTIQQDELAINAFLKMEEEDVHGLPIVDEDGVLTGCISIRDLRGVGTDGSKFFRLYRSVRSYKELCMEQFGRMAPKTHYSTKHAPTDAVFVTPDNSLEEVILKMEDGNLHRVFVCSSDSVRKGCPTPTGVISQSDVLFQCLTQMVKMSNDRSTASSSGVAAKMDAEMADAPTTRRIPIE